MSTVAGEPTAGADSGPSDQDGRLGGRRLDALRVVEREIAVLARRLKRTWVARAHDIHPDLQPSGYALLVALEHAGPSRQGDLCELLDLDKSAVSRQTHALVDLGLLARTADPDDGRASKVTVTDEGRRRVRAMEDRQRAAHRRAMAGWDEAELETLARGLTRYNATFEG